MKPTRYIAPILVLLLLASTGVDAVAQRGKKGNKNKNKELSYEEELQARRLFLNATRARLLGNDDEAMALFEKCIKLDPSNATAKYEMAKLLEHNEKTNEAIELANAAVELDKENIWFRFLQADLYLSLGQPEKAADAYRAIIDLEPNKYEVYFELAQVYISAGEYEKALKVYDEMQEKVGLAEELVMQRYHLLIGMGEFQKAIELLTEMVENQPNDPRFRGVLAELYDQIGESDKALEQYLKVLEIDPGNSMVHLALADHYRMSGDEQLAFNELKLAFEDPAVDIDTKVQILLNFYDVTGTNNGNAEQRERLLGKAKELIEVLIEVHPGNARSYTVLGDYQLRENKLREARESFRKAVELEPDKFVIWHQLVLLDSQLNDHESLILESGQAMELFPTMPVFYLYQGTSFNLLERNEEAVETLSAGKDLVIEDPMLLAQFYSGLGDAYHELGNDKDSDNYYDKSLAQDPNNIYVLNNYSYYLSLREENLDHAAEMSKRSNDLQPSQPSFLDTYAWILYKQGKYKQAREWLEKALQSGGQNNGELLEHYGDILYKLGDEQGALENWLKAKERGDTSDLIDKKISDRQLYE